jgi:methyl-accepting chemotaxis protein
MKFNSLKLGPRLGLGFGLVLLLTALVTSLGWARLQKCQDDMQSSADLSERGILAERWLLVTNSTVAKTTILAKSGFQPEFNAYLAPQIQAAADELTEIEKQLKAKVTSERGKAQLAKIELARQRYLVMRNEAFKRVKTHEPAAATFIDGEMQQAAAGYVGELEELRKMQRKLAADNAISVNAGIDNDKQILVGIAGACIAMGAFLAWRITRSITGPLRRAAAAASAIESGDLSQLIETAGQDEVSEVLKGLAAMQSSLSRIVSQVRASTDSISTASSQIASGNTDLSSRTEETASSLQQSAASMEQITGTVRQSAASAQIANGLAGEAAGVARKGGELVSEVISTMDEISQSSRKIADITSVIDGIAFQTNILALNAAVEAARAGEQGRGFAVVASEVRMLAQRSASAAKEIGVLIGRSNERVDAGARLVASAGATMKEIVGSVHRVTQVINEIVTAADEQSRGIAEVNTAVAELDRMTQANSALVEESAAAAESMRDQATTLVSLVATFRLGQSGAEMSDSTQRFSDLRMPPVASAIGGSLA